jgi:hypothetical protein
MGRLSHCLFGKNMQSEGWFSTYMALTKFIFTLLLYRYKFFVLIFVIYKKPKP